MPEGAKITQHMPMTAQVGQMNIALVIAVRIGWKKIARRPVVIVMGQQQLQEVGTHLHFHYIFFYFYS